MRRLKSSDLSKPFAAASAASSLISITADSAAARRCSGGKLRELLVEIGKRQLQIGLGDRLAPTVATTVAGSTGFAVSLPARHGLPGPGTRHSDSGGQSRRKADQRNAAGTEHHAIVSGREDFGRLRQTKAGMWLNLPLHQASPRR